MPESGIKIGLVVPVLNNFKGFAQLMVSMRGTQIFPVIIPNWEHNRGVAPSWNEGTRVSLAAGCTHVLICNDDTMLCVNGAQRLADRLVKSSFCGENVIMSTGRQVRGQPGFDGTLQGLEAMRVPPGYTGETEGDSPDFSCFMITQRTIDTVGWFDENFRPGYFEDNDYHRRIRLAGCKTANLADVPHYHVGSQTQNNPANKGPVVTGQMFDANRQYYRAKWGGVPGEEKFKTPFNQNQSFREWFPEDRQGY